MRNFREVAFRRSVVAGARRLTISNTFSRFGASKSMRSGVLRLEDFGDLRVGPALGPKRCLAQLGRVVVGWHHGAIPPHAQLLADRAFA